MAIKDARSSEEFVDIGLLLLCLWRGRYKIVVSSFIVVGISLYPILRLPDVYRSEALLVPSDAGGGGGVLGQLGGLASLAGVNIDGGSGGKSTLALAVLKSRRFITNFISRHDIVVEVLASSGWDATTGSLIINPSVFDVGTKRWSIEFMSVDGDGPSMQQAYKAFLQGLSISIDKKSGHIRVALQGYSPALAQEWLMLLVQDLNEEMRRRDLSEAETSIEYLKGQIEKTSLADMRKVFYELIEKQVKTIMFAEARSGYVFKIVDPPIAAEVPVGPSRVLFLIVAVMLGGGLGGVVVLGLGWINRELGNGRGELK